MMRLISICPDEMHKTLNQGFELLHSIEPNPCSNLPGGIGPLINIGIIGGGPLGGIPLGGIGGRMCIGWGIICIGGASPRLKKLLDISTGGGGRAENDNL